MLFLLSLIFSINLCSVAFSSISNNFECGFYSIIISSLRYRFNYWLILFHFLIFEQELILALLLIAIFFIIGTAIFRGLLNYSILNAILSIGLITSILMSNSLLLIISCYGKVGYYPFFLVLSMLFYNTSYLYIIFDLINK